MRPDLDLSKLIGVLVINPELCDIKEYDLQRYSPNDNYDPVARAVIKWLKRLHNKEIPVNGEDGKSFQSNADDILPAD